ncbi:DNA-binding transcriptional regulator CytR [Shigella dysenteriae]|uniref:DNA-binding transcriptional regulator CytR n=1 Tax=Shigella dysenteriae TaxID=622 RepID=A0A2X2KL07_SHIDY|nr:DNA-binding transcriptional regulator CytR [Shigella dysenteriae]
MHIEEQRNLPDGDGNEFAPELELPTFISQSDRAFDAVIIYMSKA